MLTTLFDLVELAADRDPDAPAITYRESTSTYGELRRAVLGVSSGFARLGAERGARVAVFLEKRHELVTTILGASAAGLAFVPINPVLKARQVEHILRDSGAAILVTSADRWRALTATGAEVSSLRHVVLVGGAATHEEGSEADTVPWDVLTAPGGPGEQSVAPVRSIDLDLGAILYTSGSTGGPKGVALTHRNLLAGADSVNAYLHNGPDDVLLAVLPFSFDAGLSQLTTGLAAGAHVVLTNYLLPRDVVKLCAQHGVTGLTCVPPLWRQIADQEWVEAGRTLRYFANTGGRLPRTVLDRLRSAFPSAAPFLMYGLTEAFRSTYLDPDEVDRRPDSIGRAIPNAEILVVAPDGSLAGPGEVGELVHRGVLVAMGYWNDPVRTAERFRPVPGSRTGWGAPEIAVWSGDLVRTDDDGFLYFVGRADEMIKTSGYRVSPTEIEEVAYATRLVGDAVALGIPDDDLGQSILLVVTAPEGSVVDVERLLAAVRKEVPRYMVPSEVVVVEEVPRGPNGKFDRATLREVHAS